MTVERIYEVRVTGLVPDTVLRGLGDVEIATQEMRTVLSGRFPDQAALYGFLYRLRTLGLDVVEVRRVAGRPLIVPSDAVPPAESSEPTDTSQPTETSEPSGVEPAAAAEPEAQA